MPLPTRLKPLYGLERLARAPALTKVLIVEGRVLCDAIQPKLPKYVVMTWVDGVYAVQDSDWLPLAFRQVDLCLNDDEQSRQAREELVLKLTNLGCKVGHVDFKPKALNLWYEATARYTQKMTRTRVRDCLIEALDIYEDRHTNPWRRRVAYILKKLGFRCKVERVGRLPETPVARVYRRHRRTTYIESLD